MTTIENIPKDPEVERLFEAARRGGAVRLVTSGGEEFVLSRVRASALDVPMVRPLRPMTRDDIVASVRVGRERVPEWLQAMFDRMDEAKRRGEKVGPQATSTNQPVDDAGPKSVLDV